MDYDKYLSDIGRRTNENPVRKNTDISAPAPYLFSAGLPCPESYPIVKATLTLRDGSTVELTDKHTDQANQYAPPKGCPELLKHIRALQKKFHNPPKFDSPPEEGGTDILMTCGSQDGLFKAACDLINPGDILLVQEPTYCTFMCSLIPFQVKAVPVLSDDQGLKPEALRETLQQWTPEQCRRKDPGVPRVLYMVPHANNPAGTCIPLERKKEIYKICQEYDILIFEDDAYYWLQFEQEAVPSFLSLDVDGRVLRFDTCSKTISAGMRLGYITGPYPLIERITWTSTLTVQHAPTWSQVVVAELMNNWGMEGYLSHIEHVRKVYREKCHEALRSADKWLTGLAEWTKPTGGMFLWIKIKGVEDSRRIVDRAIKKGVSLMQGDVYMISMPTCPYVRLSYSIIPYERIEPGFRLIAETIKEELESKKHQTVITDRNRNDVRSLV